MGVEEFGFGLIVFIFVCNVILICERCVCIVFSNCFVGNNEELEELYFISLVWIVRSFLFIIFVFYCKMVKLFVEGSLDDWEIIYVFCFVFIGFWV